MTDSLTEPLVNGSGGELSSSDRNGVEEEEKSSTEKHSSIAWLLPELLMQLRLAGPMICVTLLQYSLNLVSVMFVGHLGELALASAAIATSLAGVTGFSVLMGMGSALETLCGQANGAKQYHLLGVYLQRAIVVLNAVAVPIALIWLNMGSILKAVGQDPEISDNAGQYARYMLPSLFACAFAQPSVKFLQTQSAVLPMALCSTLTLCLHIPVCWLLIYKLGVGFRGAAIANSVSQWTNVTLLVTYIKFSATCKETWTGFSMEAFHDLKTFLQLAIPSTIMICLEYWSFELMVLMSGLLPNPQLEMSSLAICMNTIALLYMIPFGLSASVSTRVSNELGAGRASAAKKAVGVALSLGLTEGLIMSTIAFSSRHVWPYVFTNEKEVVDYVAEMIPILAVMTTLDSCQGVLSGVIRGCGSQSFAAYSNLVAYYAVGVPLAITLAFHFHLNGRGLWLGMTAALSVQFTALSLISIYTNWEKQAQDALDRVNAAELQTEERAHKDDPSSPLIQQNEVNC